MSGSKNVPTVGIMPIRRVPLSGSLSARAASASSLTFLEYLPGPFDDFEPERGQYDPALGAVDERTPGGQFPVPLMLAPKSTA